MLLIDIGVFSLSLDFDAQFGFPADGPCDSSAQVVPRVVLGTLGVLGDI